MAMQPNELIISKDVTDEFINRFKTFIDAAASSDQPPRFNSSRGIGQSGNSYIGQLNQPIAVPQSDLQNKREYYNKLNSIRIPANQLITSKAVYDSLLKIFKELVHMASYTSSWYHQVNGGFQGVETKTGLAIFQDRLSALPGWPGGQSNVFIQGWARANGSYESPASFSFTADNVAKTMTINAFINTLMNEWNVAKENRRVTYTYYTCHANCHGSCHSSRGRR